MALTRTCIQARLLQPLDPTAAQARVILPYCISRLMDKGKYSYTPLAVKKRRLLCFRPSADGAAMIEADLVHVPLTSAQNSGYIALSNCWGTSDPSAQIKLED